MMKRWRLKLINAHRRFSVLLEVIIAFALVALCVLPLIYPHVAIYRAEKQFIDTVKLDHDVSLLYGYILERLYRNTIPFSDIEGQKNLLIDDKMLHDAGIKDVLPYEGSYQFSIEQKRPSKPPHDRFLIKIKFIFKRKDAKEKEEPLKYDYDVFVERKISEEAPQEEIK